MLVSGHSVIPITNYMDISEVYLFEKKESNAKTEIKSNLGRQNTALISNLLFPFLKIPPLTVYSGYTLLMPKAWVKMI